MENPNYLLTEALSPALQPFSLELVGPALAAGSEGWVEGPQSPLRGLGLCSAQARHLLTSLLIQTVFLAVASLLLALFLDS